MHIEQLYQLYLIPVFTTVLVWQGIRDNISDLSGIFWENDKARELFKELRKVCKRNSCARCHVDVPVSLYTRRLLTSSDMITPIPSLPISNNYVVWPLLAQLAAKIQREIILQHHL